MNHKKHIPNIEGYKFVSFLPDGSSFENEVFKNDGGLHTCKKFSEIIGWIHLPENKSIKKEVLFNLPI